MRLGFLRRCEGRNSPALFGTQFPASAFYIFAAQGFFSLSYKVQHALYNVVNHSNVAQREVEVLKARKTLLGKIDLRFLLNFTFPAPISRNSLFSYLAARHYTVFASGRSACPSWFTKPGEIPSIWDLCLKLRTSRIDSKRHIWSIETPSSNLKINPLLRLAFMVSLLQCYWKSICIYKWMSKT